MLQTVKEEISHYEIFISEIATHVKKIMGGEYDLRICKVTKNNAIELDSLVMLKKDHNFAPNIYLLPYYEEYLKGTQINELAKKLCNTYREYKAPSISDHFSYSYQDIKAFITYRLVNYQKNRRLLENIPHIKFLDLAITFHCLVREDKDGIGTIRITNEHCRTWEVTPQELYQIAADNTRGLLPASIQSMDDVILGMLKEESAKDNNSVLSEAMHTDIDIHNLEDQRKMYILTNQKGINGATCLLYQDVLKDFSKRIHSDFYILPSSIHEVILVPYDASLSREVLTEMVKDVNRTQVACDEILSDNVYLYSIKKNRILW